MYNFFINYNLINYEPLAQFEVILLYNNYNNILSYYCSNCFINNYFLSWFYIIIEKLHNINNISFDFFNYIIYYLKIVISSRKEITDFFDDYIIENSIKFQIYNNTIFSYLLLLLIILFLFLPIINKLILIPNN
jgi:hypothetical protein